MTCIIKDDDKFYQQLFLEKMKKEIDSNFTEKC